MTLEPTINPEECDVDVYKDGKSVGLFDIPKELANSFCASASYITGHKYDWHYIGGRVHIKVLENKDIVRVPRALLVEHLDEIGEYAWETEPKVRALLENDNGAS